MHHIVSDGWSMAVLIRELVALYDAEAAGRAASLPALAIQYADFAAWQDNWRTGGDAANALAFWVRQLADLPRLELPTDRPRPSVVTYAGATVHTTLDERTTAAGTRLRPPDRRDAVHDDGERVRGGARPLQRPDRRADRHPVGQPQPRRARRADRLLRQRAGLARGSLRRAVVPHAGRAHEAGLARRLGAPGRAVRGHRRSAAARARAGSQSALSSDVRPAERARGTPGGIGADLRTGRSAHDDRQVRRQPLCGRIRRDAVGPARVQPRSLRSIRRPSVCSRTTSACSRRPWPIPIGRSRRCR